MKNKNILILTGQVVLYAALILWALNDRNQSNNAVKAASLSLKNGCETIGTIGTVIIARCYDEETDTFLYGNSVGWMSSPVQ